jgi:hypothetical protein
MNATRARRQVSPKRNMHDRTETELQPARQPQPKPAIEEATDATQRGEELLRRISNLLRLGEVVERVAVKHQPAVLDAAQSGEMSKTVVTRLVTRSGQRARAAAEPRNDRRGQHPARSAGRARDSPTRSRQIVCNSQRVVLVRPDLGHVRHVPLVLGGVCGQASTKTHDPALSPVWHASMERHYLQCSDAPVSVSSRKHSSSEDGRIADDRSGSPAG